MLHMLSLWYKNIIQLLICIFSIFYSPNRWTNGKHIQEWIKKVFNKCTEKKADNQSHILFLDRHSLYYTIEVIQFVCTYNIILLVYLSHCIHAPQGLDVACFGKMKMVWKEEISNFKEKNQWSITKEDFTGAFGQVYLCAFDCNTILTVFFSTGIHLFNCDIITP